MVTQEEFDAVRRRRGSGFLNFICTVAIIALAVTGGYFLLVIYVGEDAAPEPQTNSVQHAAPTYAPPPRQQQPIAQPPAPSGSLPSCETVQDTRTACQQEEEPAQEAQPLPTEPPAPSPTPAYLTACVTVPGERPCWLPADQPWTPPVEVPETPVVLVPATETPPLVFVDSACAAWHPPLAMPEGCDDE